MGNNNSEEFAEQSGEIPTNEPGSTDAASVPNAAGPEDSAQAQAEDTEALLRAEAAENWNKYLRSVAEMDNLRKRHARELENARRFGVEKLVSGLLPVRDSIEAGLKVASEADPAALDVSTLLEGEQATLRLLDQAMQEAGIRAIDPQGEPFDPDRHEAMSMLPSADVAPGSVMIVVQKGYELNERIVRPARVVVAQEPPEGAGG